MVFKLNNFVKIRSKKVKNKKAESCHNKVKIICKRKSTKQ